MEELTCKVYRHRFTKSQPPRTVLALVHWKVCIIIPVFQMRKLRLREVQSPARDHTLESDGVEGRQDCLLGACTFSLPSRQPKGASCTDS